jgi:hypothetical protein
VPKQHQQATYANNVKKSDIIVIRLLLLLLLLLAFRYSSAPLKIGRFMDTSLLLSLTRKRRNVRYRTIIIVMLVCDVMMVLQVRTFLTVFHLIF